MKTLLTVAIAGVLTVTVALIVAPAQQSDIKIILTGGDRPKIALPELRGTGAAQANMAVFNDTLTADIRDSGYFDVQPKTSYPLQIPQRPQDFKAPVNGAKQGPWLTDWSGAPVNADYLAFGYTAEQGGKLTLFGYLFNVGQPDLTNAQAINKVYFGTMDAEGARKVAHEFAADILALAGAKSLVGSKIYFTSNRTGAREIWVMDYDGANQKPVTSQRTGIMNPALSPDGTRLAYSTFAPGPSIRVLSTQTGRQLPFYNPRASLNATPEFTADGKILFASTAGGGSTNIFISNQDGTGLQRITNGRSIDIQPRVNPKNPNDIAFTSGRGGLPQVYRMNMDGTDVTRLSGGEGEATNPAWSPNGQFLAFSWTRGFAPGNYNIFVMDVASRTTIQLTHGAGRNENPTWAPDGRHLVFASNRAGGTQIWTMLADGTGLKQLTTQGKNEMPVWSSVPQ
jgi:TolB protein